VSDDTQARGCGDGTGEPGGSAPLAAAPFWAPRYHFGMLLGVDDFESEQAYHRGKTRLHGAWLHGPGVVWGYGLDLPEVDGRPGELRGELRVHPGLALDAAGRELHLETPACVSLAAWYRARRDTPEMEDAIRERPGDGSVLLDAHVVACFRACLARPVPAIAERCEGSGNDVAHSRTRETVELRLVPGRAPARDPGRYHRLRVLFGIEAPETEDGEVVEADRAVLDARADAAALPPEERAAAFLAAFRRFASEDAAALEPYADPEQGDRSLFPAPEDVCLAIGEVLDLRVADAAGDPAFLDARVETGARAAHVSTATLQELLAGALAAAAGAAAAPAPEAEAADLAPAPVPDDAGGPRIDPESVTVVGERVEMVASPRVAPASLSMDAFTVTCYDRSDGWHELEIARPPELDPDDPARIVLELKNAGRGSVVRVVARGTGPRPLLGLRGVPLAGARGGPPGTVHEGHDFVCMVKQPSTRRSR
jgi:hypothetical protein